MRGFDLLIINANILTLDAQNTIAGSVAVKDGIICDIWSQPTPPESEQITESTKIMDLGGATLVPGFIDTHNHIIDYSQARNRVNCSTPPNTSIQDIINSIQNQADRLQKGEWIVGYGYDDTLLKEQRNPTKFDLDKVSPNHPVFITHISGHLAVANSLAIELVGWDQLNSLNPSLIGRDKTGQVNGVFYEQGVEPFVNIIPTPTEDELIGLLSEAVQDYLEHGITTNTDAAIGSYLGMLELEVHLKAAAQGAHPMRTNLMIMHDLLKKDAPFSGYTAHELQAELAEKSNGLISLNSAKMFQDGSIQGLTGALREPYHQHPDLYGELFHDQKEFNEEIRDLHERGFRIAIHGNGDKAIGSILDGFQYALEKSPKKQHHHRIEHAQTATAEDLNRMKDLQVAASFFINHVYYWGDRHYRLFLGPERASRINPLKDASDRGILYTLHSDCPITPISPLFSVWAAVNRMTREGNVLGAEQRVDVITALKAMTIYAAELNFDEEWTGSIECGKVADFAVLEEDPASIDPQKIKDISVLYTLVDGKIVYEHPKTQHGNTPL